MSLIREHKDWTILPAHGVAASSLFDPEHSDEPSLLTAPLHQDGSFDPDEASEIDWYRAFDTNQERDAWRALAGALFALSEI